MTDTGRHQPPLRLTRADLDALPNYVPGRSPADLARELGLPRRSSWPATRCRTGRCPAWSRRSPRRSPASHRYPDMGVVALRDALAERYGVDADRIATGCGSVALAEHLVRATCLPGDEMLYSWRSFEAYPIIAATSGATSVRVPNDAGHGHDLAAMAAAVTDRTRMVLVCNPNNPTGTAVRRAGAGPVPRRGAGRRAGGARRGVPGVRHRPRGAGRPRPTLDRPNVVVLRTLSKAWGLAGLRIGFLVAAARGGRRGPQGGHPVLHQHWPPRPARWPRWPRPTRCSAAARWSSPSGTGSPRRCASSSPDVPASQANFVWLPLGDRAVEFGRACEARGVIVRPFAGDGVRVTIGTPAENDAFLAAAEAALT